MPDAAAAARRPSGQPRSSRSDKPADPRAVIAKKFPERQASTTCSPRRSRGSIEVPMGADTAYVSADGRYLIAGDLYEIDTRTNLTEAGPRGGARQAARQARRARHDRVLAAGREAHDHGVHRRRVRLLPQAPQPDRSAHQARRAGALRGLSARRPGHGRLAQDGSGVVLEGSPGSDHAGEARPGREGARTAARRRSAKQFQLGEDLGVRGTPAIFTHERRLHRRLPAAGGAGQAARRARSSCEESARSADEKRGTGSSRLLSAPAASPCPACLPIPWRPAARPSSR